MSIKSKISFEVRWQEGKLSIIHSLIMLLLTNPYVYISLHLTIVFSHTHGYKLNRVRSQVWASTAVSEFLPTWVPWNIPTFSLFCCACSFLLPMCRPGSLQIVPYQVCMVGIIKCVVLCTHATHTWEAPKENISWMFSIIISNAYTFHWVTVEILAHKQQF